jgi:predicted nucleic acid-binding protein
VILVDTSVWIEHLRRGHDRLAGLLNQGQVVCHPFVIGEIALGALRQRPAVLLLLAELPVVRVVGHDDALRFVERRSLGGSGIEWVDVHLLASALLERTRLWTFDSRLGKVARKLDVAWDGS